MKTIGITVTALAIWGFFSPYELRINPYLYLSICFISSIVGLVLMYFSYKRQVQKKIVQLKHERLHYEQQLSDYKQLQARLRNCESRISVSDQQYEKLIKALKNKTCRYLELNAQYQILQRKYYSKNANYAKLLNKYKKK